MVRDSQFYFVARPVICRGHPDGAQPAGTVEAERGLFLNVRCPTCKTAIEWFRTGAEPELVITDCFFDFRDHGVKIKGSRLGQVFRNAFFQKTDTDPTRAIPADISLEHCLDFNIDHNLHHEAGDTRRVGVRILDTSEVGGHVTQGIEVRKNRLSDIAVMDTYLVKGADTGNLTYEPGAFDGTLAREIDDNAATTKVTLDLSAPYTLSLSIPAPGQMLPSGGWHTLEWANVDRLDTPIVAAWTSSAPDQIVVPVDRAISLVQLRLNVEFAASSNGTRRIQVQKNGTLASDGLVLSQNAVSGLPTAMAGTTGWIRVVAGDVLSVRVSQTSGADLATDPPTTLTAWFR